MMSVITHKSSDPSSDQRWISTAHDDIMELLLLLSHRLLRRPLAGEACGGSAPESSPRPPVARPWEWLRVQVCSIHLHILPACAAPLLGGGAAMPARLPMNRPLLAA